MSDTATSTPELADQLLAELFTAPPADPYPLYNRLRESAPIHRSAMGGFWVLTRYADCHQVLKDQRFVRDYAGWRRRGSPGSVNLDRPFLRQQRQWMAFANPPEYRRKRSLYVKAFSRAYVDGLRPMIAGIANGLLDEVEPRGDDGP